MSEHSTSDINYLFGNPRKARMVSPCFPDLFNIEQVNNHGIKTYIRESLRRVTELSVIRNRSISGGMCSSVRINQGKTRQTPSSMAQS